MQGQNEEVEMITTKKTDDNVPKATLSKLWESLDKLIISIDTDEKALPNHQRNY